MPLYCVDLLEAACPYDPDMPAGCPLQCDLDAATEAAYELEAKHSKPIAVWTIPDEDLIAIVHDASVYEK